MNFFQLLESMVPPIPKVDIQILKKYPFEHPRKEMESSQGQLNRLVNQVGYLIDDTSPDDPVVRNLIGYYFWMLRKRYDPMGRQTPEGTLWSNKFSQHANFLQQNKSKFAAVKKPA